MKRIAIYPGSFDPITNGHIDLIKRASNIFDEVVVAVAQNISKKPLFTVSERLELVKQATKGIKKVRAESFSGLMINYVKSKNAKIILRGLRMISDFEYEFQMALTNRQFNPHIETVFLMPSDKYSFISSSLLKETSALGADISAFVPDFVERRMKEKLC